MILVLESGINPDHNHEYNRAIPRTEVKVESLRQARQACDDYIRETGIGGGNWRGGQVWEDGCQIARISYNRRIWGHNGKEIILDK